MSEPNKITRVYEYGKWIDCAKNGCATPHRDNGVVTSVNPGDVPGKEEDAVVNGHACRWVRRWVDTGPWLPVRSEVSA